MEQVGEPNAANEIMLIALGSNVSSRFGDPATTLRHAIADMEQALGEVVAVSRFYRTPAFPAGAGPDFVNAAVALRTDRAPEAVLEVLHRIEADHGRERVVRWGQRTLDLDLIAAGAAVLPDRATCRNWLELPPQEQARRAPDTLILPHPRLQDRPFVLVPLADIAPDWRHPVLGQTVAEMLAEQDAAALAEVVAIGAA